MLFLQWVQKIYDPLSYRLLLARPNLEKGLFHYNRAVSIPLQPSCFIYKETTICINNCLHLLGMALDSS